MIKFLGGGQADVLIARHHDRLTRNPDDFARLMQICGKAKIRISLYTGGELDLSTASGGSTASWRPVDLGMNLRSEASASKTQSSATSEPESEPEAGPGRSATRSSATTWARVRDGGIGSAGLLDDPSRRRENFGRPRVHSLVGPVYCASCGERMTTAIAPKQGRGYGCRKDENLICPAPVRIVAGPLEAYVEGYVIDQWRNAEAIKIARSDDERMMRIREITEEMRHLQEQKNEALRMKLRGDVDAKTFREVTAEIDAAHDQLAREHNRLASDAAMPELPDPSLAWEDLSAEDRRALTKMLVDKIVVTPHPHKIVDGRRHYTIRSIPYQDPREEADRLKAVHEARVKIVPRV